ncbi:MAG: glycosyltransferase family 39 protein [Myxococcales bacterium]|nr:glycosyltransferase family 39 protein [Myxococcota bacterium]MDW8281608.1 glycosyltransferase family 39 protein [Myxococcales bacterium]
MSILVPLLSVIFFGSLLIELSLMGVPTAERRRLRVIVLVGLALRLALAVVLEVFPQFRLFHDDAGGYELNAMAMARAWKGLGPPVVLTWHGALTHGYVYVGAVLCFLFGVFPLHLAAWNGLFGVLTVIFLYRLARHLFHSRVAFRAALLLAFMPSMIVWNSVAIKDPIMVLLVTVSLYIYMLLRRRWSTVLLLILVATVSASFFIRFYISYFLILSIFLTVLVGRTQEGTSRVRNLLIVAAFAIAVGLTGLSRNLSQGLELANLEQVALYRAGMASTANSGFGHDLDVSSPRGALLALPMGLAVVLFGPFPWQMRSLLPLSTLPEMLLWWYLVPSLWRGIRFAFTRSFSRGAPVFVFCISLSIAYSLTLGNVGAAVRQRTQIFVFLFVFVALGQFVKYCHKHRINPDLLIRPPAPAGG